MVKQLVVTGFILLFSLLATAETQMTVLQDIQKPGLLWVDDTQMYVIEDTSIYIYDLKDFKLKKKFGKRGEGPQEFMLHPRVVQRLVLNIQTDEIVVNSLGKLSFFSKDGVFKRELKLPHPLMMGLGPLGKNFVGVAFENDKEIWRCLNLYDEKLNKIKEIKRIKHTFQQGKGLRVLDKLAIRSVYDNKLFIAWEDEIKIQVLDSNTAELYTINYQMEKEEVTEADKEKIIHFFKHTNPNTKEIYDMLKPIIFPTHFPAMRSMSITGDKIYILTFKKFADSEKGEFIILGLKGKFLGRALFPLKMSSPVQPYPYNVHKGKFYQIVENADEEEWYIHITDLKPGKV